MNMKRLWTNPPTTPEGLLDYSALTLAEIREDLVETVSDFILNSGWSALQEALDILEDDALADALERSTIAPPDGLVKIMSALLEHASALRLSSEHQDLIREAVRQLQDLAQVNC